MPCCVLLEVLLIAKLEQEEKRILDRELARAKVSANRVAVVVANDWKDASDKVMPVKQWLEERKFYQVSLYLLIINCLLLINMIFCSILCYL